MPSIQFKRTVAAEGRGGLSLRYRFLALFLLIFAVGASAGYGAVAWLTKDIVGTLLGWYAERNALYEKSRVMQVLLPEVSLAGKLARSPALKSWAVAETDPALKARGVAELEHYREFFRSKSYFFALAGSGNYYFNDEAGGYDPQRARYRLSATNPKDQWFYSTLRRVPDYELNVDTDRHLGVTKVWINAVVRSGGAGLAVVGTGLDLSGFIKTVIGGTAHGVTNILLDRNGAIQAHPDVSMIDFASIARRHREEQQSTIFSLVEDAKFHGMLRAALDSLSSAQRDTQVIELPVEGQLYMAGITYVPEIKWFVVTLTHPSAAGKRYYPLAIAAVLVAALALTLVLAGLAFDRMVLRRLAELDRAARRIGSADYDVVTTGQSGDELGRLGGVLREMAARVAMHTQELEHRVAERTSDLERLAYTDYLTGLLNRRGVIERMNMERNRLMRHKGLLGVLILDLDHFKRINDQHGHEAGDRVLARVAGLIRGAIRSYDLCARWGGEEFLVIVPGVSHRGVLASTAEKLARVIRRERIQIERAEVSVTASIGGCLMDPGQDIDAALKLADDALYEAKNRGRNRIVVAETSIPRESQRRPGATARGTARKATEAMGKDR